MFTIDGAMFAFGYPVLRKRQAPPSAGEYRPAWAGRYSAMERFLAGGYVACQVRLLTTTLLTGVSFIDHEYAAGPAGPL
jgi:hypothetical protein